MHLKISSATRWQFCSGGRWVYPLHPTELLFTMLLSWSRHIRRHRIGFCSYTDLEMFFHPWPWPKTQDPGESDCPYFPALITYDTEMAFTGFPIGIDDNQLINMGIVSTCVVDFKSKSRRCIKHTIFMIRRRHIARKLQINCLEIPHKTSP